MWKENSDEGELVTKGRDNSPLNGVAGVFKDRYGSIYVSDRLNTRVEKIIGNEPRFTIKANELSSSIQISGIEELPHDNEENENIIFDLSSNSSVVAITNTEDLSITIKNNSLDFEKKDNPFISLSNSSASWGDYDRDGDLDLAIMGQSNTEGAVTAIYENDEGTFVDTNQNFTPVYSGDISWVDLNKDGWLDLIVSGFNQEASTKIYINDEGKSLAMSSDDWGIPDAYDSTMSWGDLDNDGDVDLAFVGIDENDTGFSYLYLRVDNENKFIVQDLSYFSGGGFKNGDLEIADFDQDSDNDLIFTGERSNGELRSQIKLNSFISPEDPKFNDLPLTFSRDKEEDIPYALTNSSISTYFNQQTGELSYIIIGRNSENELKTLIRSVGGLNRESNTPLVELENGDVAIGDVNNDGFNDFLYTGEDVNGSAITKLYFTNETTFYDSNYDFVGLRESTAQLVDYDSDGDLDIFLSGLGEDGAETILYQVNLNSKVNEAPSMVSNLSVTNLGFGNVQFDWDKSEDDFSNKIGYALKLGT